MTQREPCRFSQSARGTDAKAVIGSGRKERILVVTQTVELKQIAQDNKIFRQETLTDIANIKTAMNYYNPFANMAEEDTAQVLLPTGEM